MSLIFKGIAHPPAKGKRDHPSDLSFGELNANGRGKLNGLPVHVEHDTKSASIGNVLTSFEGSRGELRVIGQITDPEIAAQVRDGSLRGLSLGTDCIQNLNGDVLTRSQKELSICEEGRRNGTWITHLDNKLVHTVAAFSKSASCKCCTTLTITHRTCSITEQINYPLRYPCPPTHSHTYNG